MTLWVTPARGTVLGVSPVYAGAGVSDNPHSSVPAPTASHVTFAHGLYTG